MKTKRKTAIFLALTALALIVASCDNTFGVFSEIQTEQPQVGTDVFRNATLKHLAEDASNYYAAMAKVLYRAKSAGSAWAILPIDGSTEYYCSGLASDPASDTLYVAISDPVDTSLTGIYSTADSGVSWNALDAGALAGLTVDALFVANGTLFVAAHDESTVSYKLYYYNAGAFVSALAGGATLVRPVTGVVYDAADYWVGNDSELFSGAAGSIIETSESGVPAGKGIGGIAVEASGDLLVSCSDGTLYRRSSGVWSNITLNADTGLGLMLEVPTPGLLIIGRKDAALGYYESDGVTAGSAVAGADASAQLVPAGSLYTTTINGKPITALLLSKDGKTIFIGVAAQGTTSYALYSNSYSTGDAAWAGWTAE